MSLRTAQLKMFFAHFVISMLVNSLQPLIRPIQSALNLTIPEIGLITMMLTFSSVLANLVAGFLIAKVGHKKVFLAAGFMAIIGSVMGYLADSYAFLIITYLIIGTATGFFLSSLATLFAHLPNKYHNFGLFHGSFGFGGFAAPLLVGLMLRNGMNYKVIYLISSCTIFLTVILFAFSKEITNQRFADFALKDMIKSLRKPLIFVPIVILSLYASLEIGISYWAGNVNGELFLLSEADTSFLLSIYWIFYTIARLATDSLARRLGAIQFSRILVILIIATVIIWILGVSPYLFLLLGLFLGPIFPTIQKLVTQALTAEEKGLFNAGTFASTGLFTTAIIPIMTAFGDIQIEFIFMPSLVVAVLFLLMLPLQSRIIAKSHNIA